MSIHRRWSLARGTLLSTVLLSASLLACGTDGDGPDDTTVEDRSPGAGTAVPPDPNGVGGGVPVDNLNPDVADTRYQNVDDVDGDGDPER